eukprot:TRINITY_DN18807_c0_g1_i1.p1 TRINITY_DN18807_c0_g1~~TRINITY_DN18807_c0_g1_i1.p1  ORF type:complete len:226 (+),score=44.53 TRINITY_DN18807_c0_g1_i1:44-721(+)
MRNHSHLKNEELEGVRNGSDDVRFVRSRSTTTLDSHSKESLLTRIQQLEKTVNELKWRIEAMEEDVGLRTRWGVRYSRRMAIVANVLLGLWNFWGHLSHLLKKRRRHIMTFMLVSPSNKIHENLDSVIYEVLRKASLRSSIFFICSFLLYSKFSWKRILGLIFSTFAALYMSPNHTQLGNYFTVFANLLYGTASWSLSTKPTQKASQITNLTALKNYIRESIQHF